MIARPAFRRIIGRLFWPALVILALNLEKVAEAFGWDTILLKGWSPGTNSLLAALQFPLVQYAASFMAGAGVALWVDRVLRGREALLETAPRSDAVKELASTNNSTPASSERAMWDRLYHRLADDRVQLAEDLVAIRRRIFDEEINSNNVSEEINKIEIRSAKFMTDEEFKKLWLEFYDASAKYPVSLPKRHDFSIEEEYRVAGLIQCAECGDKLDQAVKNIIAYLVPQNQTTRK